MGVSVGLVIRMTGDQADENIEINDCRDCANLMIGCVVVFAAFIRLSMHLISSMNCETIVVWSWQI
jgi:hypothetical protein